MPSAPFKKCSKCRFVWRERTSFLTDPNVKMVGYQVHFEKLKAGLFLFDHSCRTTMAVEAGKFQDLYDGPMFADNLTGTEDGEDRCLQLTDLHPCRLKCECTYVRNVAQIILNWPKRWWSVIGGNAISYRPTTGSGQTLTGLKFMKSTSPSMSYSE
jgi:hypothetical protein